MSKKDPNQQANTDIKSLFDGISDEPGKQIDLAVLDHAFNALEEDETLQIRRVKSKTSSWAPAFAVAAVVVLGVVLVPLLMRAPESQLTVDSVSEVSVETSRRLDEDPETLQNRQGEIPEPPRLQAPMDSAAEGISARAIEESIELNESVVSEQALGSSMDADAPTQDTASQAETIPVDQTRSQSAQVEDKPVQAAKVTDTQADAVKAVETKVQAAKAKTARAQAAQSNATRANVSQLQSQSTASIAADSTASNASSAKESNEPAPVTPAMPSVQGINNNLQLRSFSANKSVSDFRDTAITWVMEIKRLFSDPDTKKALEELKQFRKKHPNSTHEALLPEALLELAK